MYSVTLMKWEYDSLRVVFALYFINFFMRKFVNHMTQKLKCTDLIVWVILTNKHKGDSIHKR